MRVTYYRNQKAPHFTGDTLRSSGLSDIHTTFPERSGSYISTCGAKNASPLLSFRTWSEATWISRSSQVRMWLAF